MREPKDIFISYRRKDGADLAEAVNQILENQGFSVFFDKKSIPYGASFPSELEEAVKKCNEFIVINTQQYFGKDKKGVRRIYSTDDWVRNELRLALEYKKNIFPILATKLPKADNLPLDVRPICERQCIPYNKASDTLSNIINRIKEAFSDSTKENALIGSIKNRLQEVNVKDNDRFNEDCKEIIKLIVTESDMESLYRILSRKEDNILDKRINDKDFRFVVLYTLLTYFRRRNMPTRLIKMVEDYGDDFKDYPFYHYVKTEYFLEKAKTSATNEDVSSSFLEAIRYAKSAIYHIGNNIGIIHSLPFTIATALEYGVKVPEEDIQQALTNVTEVITRRPDYGGMYYSTKARLLGQIGEYEEALRNIRIAQNKETPRHSDWMLRIATYQKQELEIMMKANLNQLQMEVDKIKNNFK